MPNQLIKLPHSFISITGDGAEKFLQGQVSCDLSKLNEHSISFGTINNPKGRMYSLFKIIRTETGFLLCLEPSTVEFILTNLNKYKVFFKCELKEEQDLFAYGILGQISQDELTNFSTLPEYSMQLFRRNDNEYIHRLPCSSKMYELWTTNLEIALENIETNSADNWFAAEANEGLPQLYQSTQEKFILQDLNLQTLQAVSFKKGCYTGQEIIARMKFLGKQKKKMYCLNSSKKEIASAGNNIYDDQGKKCGTIVRSHWSKEIGSVSLAIINIAFVEKQQKAYLNETTSTPFDISEIDYNFLPETSN